MAAPGAGRYSAFVEDGEDFEAFRKRKRAEFLAYEFPPNIIMDSGRGIWGIWEMEEMLSPDDVEAINAHLIQTFDGGHCHINRLPHQVAVA